MARLSRRELKEDKFISEFEETLLFLEESWEMLLALVLVVVIGAGALVGWWWYADRQEHLASRALSQALETYAAPIRLNPGDLPPGYPGPSFSSQKEKYETAQKEFAELRQKFARTSVGGIAKHYEALCLWQLGRQTEALKLLEEASQAADPERAALARLHLASIYQKLGRIEQARQLYQRLTENPTVTVPREVALLALADLYATTRPAEARKLYEELKRTLGGTPAGNQVTRRLEMLPPAP